MTEVTAQFQPEDKDGNAVGDKQKVKIDYDFPADIDAMCQRFGDQIVFDLATARLTVWLQDQIRRMSIKGDKADAIEKHLAIAVPEARQKRLSTVDRISRDAAELSPDQIKELLEKLQTSEKKGK